MRLSLETKATGIALASALISLGAASVFSEAIALLPNSATPAPTPPVEISTSPEIVNKGQQFFAMSCTECHGDDAHGDEGPDLHRLAISNARIATTIRKGIKGEMPTFARKYDDAQIAALVSYLRTLR